jgi:hypothetical protein
MVPLLVRGLRHDNTTAIKRKAAVIIENMAKLVDNPLDAVPFLPSLLPGEQGTMVTPTGTTPGAAAAAAAVPGASTHQNYWQSSMMLRCCAPHTTAALSFVRQRPQLPPRCLHDHLALGKGFSTELVPAACKPLKPVHLDMLSSSSWP